MYHDLSRNRNLWKGVKRNRVKDRTGRVAVVKDCVKGLEGVF